MSKSIDDLAKEYADGIHLCDVEFGSEHDRWVYIKEHPEDIESLINCSKEGYKAGYKQRNDELAEWIKKMRESNCVSTPQEVLKMLAEAFHQKSFEDFDTREQSIALWMAENLL